MGSSLLRLIRSESRLSPGRLVLIAALAGLGNAFILVFVNIAAEQGSNGVSSPRTLAFFLVTLAVYILAQRQLLLTTTAEIEEILDRIRRRISGRIRHSELLELEHVGRAVIYSSVGKDSLTISQAASTIVIACQSAVVVFFVVLYLASISQAAFLLSLLVAGIAFWLYRRRAEEIQHDLHAALDHENRYVDTLGHLLDGFKEVKLNRARGDDLHQALAAISESATRIKIWAQRQFAVQYLLSQFSFYLLIATVVFVLPRLLPTYSDVLTRATASILFVIGPIGLLVSSIPIFAAANAAAENIDELEAALSRFGREPARTGPSAPDLRTFSTIELHGVVFRYPHDGAEAAFIVGPLDLTLRRGEKLFVIGGNGSGKSTFLRLLTALYPPTAGALLLDRIPVDASSLESFRSLFSSVFSDYHLFDRLYGLRDVDPQRVEDLLRLFQLESKTRLVDGRFETLELSSGQRKRLALLVSLLEDRPILVFDEWAADQDPGFRRYFYEELLPRLEAAGKTIVAITHDDRYFHLADRVLQMMDGRFIGSQETTPP